MAQSRKMWITPCGGDAAPQHRSAKLLLAALLLAPCVALAAPWGCHGTKPGHPTAAERAAFVREVSGLAIRAEQTHGVPASALAAIAIAESGYGYTRIAIDANNLFAWKFVPAAAKSVREYVLDCERRNARTRFAAFDSKAHAFDFVASNLATLEAYREHTQAYQAARSRGVAPEVAVIAWIEGVATKYSVKPADFARKLTRIMNDPFDPRDTPSQESNLYRLSAAFRVH